MRWSSAATLILLFAATRTPAFENDSSFAISTGPSAEQRQLVGMSESLTERTIVSDSYRLGYDREYRWQSKENNRFSVWNTSRSYFLADLRLEFTGQEVSFNAENQTLTQFEHDDGNWATSVTGEFYLNLPFDRNVLRDFPLRESFAHNFEIDTFEISQLYISLGREYWAVDLGRFETPFGRYYEPIFTNARSDAPFIRTESILFRETGLQVRFEPGPLRLAVAVTDGSNGRDTNSSKALIARAGFENETLSTGASVKWQDGVGSETQKEFKNHAGLDLSFRRGIWRVAAEVIYDQYGLRRPGFSLDDIDWGRSIYNRQLNNGLNNPIEGWGWYINLMRQTDRLTTVIGYGEFRPEAIGNAIHDTDTRRILIKAIRRVNSHLDLIATGLFENSIDNGQAGRLRRGEYILAGLQFRF
jgi:hypothetical protein